MCILGANLLTQLGQPGKSIVYCPSELENLVFNTIVVTFVSVGSIVVFALMSYAQVLCAKCLFTGGMVEVDRVIL